jgi:hypothetical protein
MLFLEGNKLVTALPPAVPAMSPLPPSYRSHLDEPSHGRDNDRSRSDRPLSSRSASWPTCYSSTMTRP